MKRTPVVLLLAAALAWGVLRWWLPAAPVDFEQAEAFGAQTTSQFAQVDGVPIHCRDARDVDACIAGARQRGARPAVLWFGNSQLHAINQYQPGEVTAVPRLSARAAAAGLDVLACSQPSGSFQEQLLLYAYLLARLPVHTLVLPAVYDDTREDGVRDTLSALLDDAAVAQTLGESDIGQRLLRERRAGGAGDGAAPALSGSLQAGMEQRLDDWLIHHSALWAARDTMRGQLFNALYIARNTVFGIRSTTHRRRIAGRYAANLAALEEMLRLSQQRGVRVLLYVAPIRSDVPMPYDPADYAQFKDDARQLAQRHGAQFADLESLVPAPSWGVKAAGIAGAGSTEVDFMHFRAAGHALLAERVAGLLGLDAGGRGAMSFNSVSYLLFLAIVVAVYWLLPGRLRPALLLAASLCFYACWKPLFVLVMIASALTDYVVALRMQGLADERERRRWLLLSVAVNLGLLGYFKYLQFVVDNGVAVLHLLGVQVQSPALQVLLPLGISFYTFETLSYIVDVYRGQRAAEPSLLRYGCFVAFFPKLVAGPILRASELLPQFARVAHFDAQQAAAGVVRIVIGLALKVAVADSLAPLVDEGFLREPAQLSALDVWTLSFLFGFQIYCDFAAYSAIAIGSAQLLGIHVPENFDWPYLARSPRDFWRRWHISLSTWIRDYLYLPLQGIRPRAVGSAAGPFDVGEAAVPGGAARSLRGPLRALCITWAVMGLWHGAHWHFLLWGLYHALLIAVYRRAWPDARWPLAGWALTLATVMLGWIPFRAADVGDALSLWAQLLRPHAYTWLGLRENSYLVAALLLVGMVLCRAAERALASLRRRSALADAALMTGGLTLLLVAVFLFLRPVSQFLYFQF